MPEYGGYTLAALSDLTDADLDIYLDSTGTLRVPLSVKRQYFHSVESGEHTASFSFAAAHAGTVRRANSSSPIVATVPSATFPVNTVIGIAAMGTGTVSVAAGASVTVNSRGGVLTLAGQYAQAALWHYASGLWLLAGDLG